MVESKIPEEADDRPTRPPTAEERATICAQAIVDAQIRSGSVTQDGMVVMMTRQLLEHEDCAYERVILLCELMAKDDEIETFTAKEILGALVKELRTIQQPPPGQPGVILT